MKDKSLVINKDMNQEKANDILLAILEYYKLLNNRQEDVLVAFSALSTMVKHE